MNEWNTDSPTMMETEVCGVPTESVFVTSLPVTSASAIASLLTAAEAADDAYVRVQISVIALRPRHVRIQARNLI